MDKQYRNYKKVMKLDDNTYYIELRSRSFMFSLHLHPQNG